jgi:hypothetical protein
LSDDAPAYLQVFGPIDKPLKGFDETDLPGGAPKLKKESADVQMARVIRPMPASQMSPLGGRGPEPEWLLKGEPRPVQIEALRRSFMGWWLQQGEDDDNQSGYRVVTEGLARTGPARGWSHYMEQRLGKTPVLLNEIALLRRDYDSRWAVVLAPNQFKPDWAAEAERFGLDCPTWVFDSADRTGAQRWVDKNRKHGGLIALNYEALLSDKTLSFLEALAGPQSLIGFDESVSIKNSSGALAKRALSVAKSFGWKRALTGKPVVQGPHDLFMQLRATGALNGTNFFAFRNRFCKLGGFQGKVVTGAKNEEELQEILAAWTFLARRVNWLKTPGRDYATQRVEMLPEQKTHYKRMETDFLTELKREGFETEVIAADQIVTKLLKLQQIASGFIIDEVGRAHDIMPPKSNPKLQHVKRMLQEQLDTKTIIFAHYQHSIRLLRSELAEFNPAFIVGASQAREFGIDVQAEKRRFNADPSCRVVIGQEQAIRYGHTLMGTPDDPCLNEVFYENNYSLNDRSQCEERPQGAGQVGAITIYDLMCAPIEQDIIDALVRKEDVSSAVMNYARNTGVLGK